MTNYMVDREDSEHVLQNSRVVSTVLNPVFILDSIMGRNKGYLVAGGGMN